jgi:8-oxo-dGTP pyrophosphatase MutT (NUDIX family)
MIISEHQIIHQLEKRLADPLPGSHHQLQMAPINGSAYLEPDENHRKACVMILLYPQNGEWHMTYIKRTSHNPDDRHAGQISFPGGKVDEEDKSFLACAIRETEEEVGIYREKIEVIGELTSLYVHVSNFLVYPFVGFISEKPSFVRQESEVADIITPRLSYMGDQKIIKSGDIPVRGMVIKDMPYYDLHGKVLWGATAMITSEFLTALREAENY